MDGRDDEAARGITIKSTGISMFFEYDPRAGGAREVRRPDRRYSFRLLAHIYK
jgi:translation elongation factor EF-G